MIPMGRSRLGQASPLRILRIGPAPLHLFAYIGIRRCSTTAQEAKNRQRDLPIGIIASLLDLHYLYISVSAILTGMLPWQDINN